MPHKNRSSKKSVAPRQKGKKSSKTTRTSERLEATAVVSRATGGLDEDEVLLMGGGGGGASFGRCGGRVLGSRLEQQLCDQLSRAGIIHSHSPRHFEVKVPVKGLKGEPATSVAAYAPMIVLRGRGREGKTVVIEACVEVGDPVLKKIEAFRTQYGLEFYVIFVAPEEIVDDVPRALFDEACAETELGTLINRLSD
jgi:hypothetical protein